MKKGTLRTKRTHFKDQVYLIRMHIAYSTIHLKNPIQLGNYTKDGMLFQKLKVSWQSRQHPLFNLQQ